MSRPVRAAVRKRFTIALDLRYGLFVVAYVALLYTLGARPEPQAGRNDLLTQLATNLYHVPLYAGLAYFVLQAISGGEGLGARPAWRVALTVLLAGALAALDEWHQVAIPDRDASLGDFLLDMTGIVGLLLVCALGTKGESPP